jgi:CBS domain-containing protein
MRVDALMTTAVISLHARDPLSRAREEMETASIRHLPVVDDSNHVLGILSDRDLLRASSRRASTPVALLMTREVVTVRPSTPAHEALAMMMELKIGSLPVVGADEQLVGVITETDFLAVAREALQGHSLHARED